jgi:hypothetical protein
MRMRQSLAELEHAFVEEISERRELDEQRRREAILRGQRRQVERRNKRGRTRFFLLVLALLGTAVGVTIAMFQVLYLVMG